MSEEHLLWKPSKNFSNNSNLNKYNTWLKENRKIDLNSYDEIWDWSVNCIDQFWESILDYFKVEFDGKYTEVVKDDEEIIGAKWFEGISLSYAEHIFKNYNSDQPAIISKIEGEEIRTVAWKKLKESVSKLAFTLKSQGIIEGDRVCCVLPNCPEALISFLAVNSIGAIWSSCAPDFGVTGIVDRFVQIKPKAFITCNGYKFNGQTISLKDKNKKIIARLSSLKTYISIQTVKDLPPFKTESHISWEEISSQNTQPLKFTRVAFSHAIWVLYSSGTTGKPKAITHSTGGILIEHLKALSFHQNVKAGDRFFWNSNIGWMMWNYANSCLLAGGIVVLYDGSPVYPKTSTLWDFAKETKITHFGGSAVFFNFCKRVKLKFNNESRLVNIESISSTGSPLNNESFDWIYNNVKKDLWLISLSGGTDVCSGFVGGNPLNSVYRGQIQCRMLGVKLESYCDQGNPLRNHTGEMVIEKPMPSMPIYFWGDKNNTKYKSSYFEKYQGKWRHGDYIKIFNNGGVEIFGRSDATLNRGGVRIGTSEVYSCLDKINLVLDALIIYLDKQKRQELVLFVKLKKGEALTKNIIKNVKNKLKRDYSSFHVPDQIIQVSDIPYTLSGKKMEIPIKNLFMGYSESKTISTGAMKNPTIIKEFSEIYKNNFLYL